jgi:predicted nucleic acid-binding protein
VKVTIDASVAVKWFVREDHRKEARHVLGPRIKRYAPDLLPLECASAICKKADRGEIGRPASFLDEIARLGEVVRMRSSADLLRNAAETALLTGHPIYDCLYIACAKLTGSILVTADRKLGKVVTDRVPDIEATTLQDTPAMARVEAAGIRLVIERDTVEELIELWEREDATRRSVEDDIHPDTGQEFRLITGEATKLAMESPTYLGLLRAIEALSHDERMDLLVLGWIGVDRRRSRRQMFDTAVGLVNDAKYITGLGRGWRAGLRRWSTWDRTVASEPEWFQVTTASPLRPAT